MRVPTLTELLALLAARSVTVTAQNAADGNPQATQVVDEYTGITFLAYADGTGYQFGLALPEDPTTDFIVQLMSPLSSGAGWAGIDFGAYMTDHLLLVAWPNGNDVMISARYARGYTQTETVAYPGTVALTPIANGTFVNGTHVCATFLCGGCMNQDSFANVTVGTDTFGFAYSNTPVNTPADLNTLLSDHTANNEPYGPFDVTFAQAQSSSYAAWAAMAGAAASSAAAGGNANATASPTPPSAGSGAGSGTPSPTASSGASGTPQASGSATTSDTTDTSLFTAVQVMGLSVMGIGYVLHAFNWF